MHTISLITRLFICWMFFVSGMIFMVLHTSKTNNDAIVFFKFGPSHSLSILGICIDTYYKYYSLIVLCCMNSMFRAIHTSYIQPWIINNIQDSKVSLYVQKRNVYEIIIINTIYIWFDWCMYMNILLSQIDMLMTEIISDVVMTCLVTQYHMYQKQAESTTELYLHIDTHSEV